MSVSNRGRLTLNGIEPAPASPEIITRTATMGRQPLHSDTVRIEQKDDVEDASDRESEIILVDNPLHPEWAEELAFQEEPVTIILNPSTDKNAPNVYPIWVNGKGAEVFQRGQWMEIGYLPVGVPLTIKRKYLEVIMRAKLDMLNTVHEDSSVERPRNTITRQTNAVHSYSILKDANPKGGAWAVEMMRRNM